MPIHSAFTKSYRKLSMIALSSEAFRDVRNQQLSGDCSRRLLQGLACQSTALSTSSRAEGTQGDGWVSAVYWARIGLP